MKPVIIRSFVVFIIFITGAIIGYKLLYSGKKLPVLTPAQINPLLMDSSVNRLSKEHFIGAFKLINQKGDTITEETFKDKIYITDFIFTTCPNMCPKMTSNMQLVHQEFLNDTEIAFISHSVTPEEDSVPVLMEYSKKYNAQAPKWNFVTGDKKLIYKLAREHYFAATTKGNGGIDDFIHTENFVLIDKKKQIRGIYDGTSFEEIDQLIKDISTLKEESN